MTSIIAIVSGKQSTPVNPKRPRWVDMINYYPDTSIATMDLYNTIGGGLPEYLKQNPVSWENSCCIRMSYGLNYSGLSLPKAPSTGGTIIGKDKKNYWIRVNDLISYLKQKFGKPEIESVGGKTAVQSFKGKKGIIVFEVSGWGNATGHFTLWDGEHLVYPGNPLHDNPSSEYYYFSMKYEVSKGKFVQTQKVYLWELK